MKMEEIFTAEELGRFRDALKTYRPEGSYQEGKWMVSALNRRYGTEAGNFPTKVKLRDITLRTTEQMPGVVISAEDRRRLLVEMVKAGIPDVVLTSFRRGHTLQDLQESVQAAKAISPDCELSLGNAVKPDEMEMAAAAGVDAVQVWSATYLGAAMPVSAGAVYHRVWQGRDWHDLKFPTNVEEHIDRSRRLIRAGRTAGVKVSATVNLLHLATEEYIAAYCAAAEQEGAYEIVLADSAGGTAPEAVARAVEVARSAAPNCEIGLHAHNIFGMAVAASISAAKAGATVLEVAVNGYEVGPAGCQASVAATATALEALYGVHTGIDLSKMVELSELAAELTGWPVPWNESVVGSGIFESSSADEYEMEANFDRLIHAAIEPTLVGGKRIRRVGVVTGPLAMWDILDELGVKATKEQIEPILTACLAETANRGRTLEAAEVKSIARSVTGEQA